MVFGLGLPPHRYVLDKLGAGMRGYYEHLMTDDEPRHLRPLLDQLQERVR